VRITLRDLISEADDLLGTIVNLRLDEEQSKGAEIVMRAIEQHDIAVGVGPPGTGKTLVFSNAIAEEYSKLREDEVIVYVAPTNQLVSEEAKRTIAYLRHMGYNERELMNSIRVYGSRFEPLPLNERVKLIFTTGYQPSALRNLAKHKKAVHLLVDEASTTALHEAFMPLSQAIALRLAKDKSLELLGSLAVIGDPMQAIVDPSYGWRWKFEQLLVTRLIMTQIPESEREQISGNPPLMFELARKYAGSSSGSRYFFLGKTFRIPKPTEIIVSIPFYNRLLGAERDYKSVMKEIKSGGKPLSFVYETKLLKNYQAIIDNAIDSQYPIVYIKHEGLAYRGYLGLDEYDERRAILGAEMASYLALVTTLRRVTVITPYNEMALQMRYYVGKRFKRFLGDERRRLRFATVHSSIGLDSEAVIVVMGKEHRGELGMETLYFQTPELINVQFSRHMVLLVIIGNIERLCKQLEEARQKKEDMFMSKIGEGLREALEELKAKDVILIKKMKE